MDASYDPVTGYGASGAAWDGPFEDGDIRPLDGEDEVLAAGTAHPVLRWLGRVVVAGVALTALVVAGGRHTGRLAAPPTPGPRPSVLTPRPVAASSVHALLVAPRLRRVYTVIAGRVAVNTIGGDDRFAISSTALRGAVDPDRLRLILNPSDDVLWVVPLGGQGSHLLEGFDPRTLRRVAAVRLAFPMDNPSVLDGRLYLNDGPELFRVSTDHRRLELAARLIGSGGPMAGDPSRHRLLYFDYYNPLTVRSWSPRTGEGVAARLPITRGQVAVVRGAVWTTGYGLDGRAAVLRLDPRTLRPDRRVATAAGLGAGATIAGVGATVVYLRAAGDPGLLLCLDGRTGSVDARWVDEPGAVGSTAATILVASPTRGVRPLPAKACAG